MSTRVEGSVFLERRSYRRRRMLDGLKLLPVLSAWLFMLPVLWPDAGAYAEEPRAMSSALIYIFCVWLVLIVFGAILVVVLERTRAPEPDEVEEA